MRKTGDFESITVVDRENVVRAAGDPARVGQPYVRPAGESLGAADGRVQLARYVVQGEPVLGFEAPIFFQGKPVGRVALGLAERPLVKVARLSQGLMAVLVVVTVLAVAIAMYFVANWFSRPIKQVIDAMAEIGRGHLDHRIAEQRKDEFGLLFAAFDRMAQALQDALPAPAAVPPATVPPAARATPPAAAGETVAIAPEAAP